MAKLNSSWVILLKHSVTMLDNNVKITILVKNWCFFGGIRHTKYPPNFRVFYGSYEEFYDGDGV